MALNVHRFGPADGAPVLCLHGVTGHGARFRRLAEEGLPHRRVLAVDLRGHGRSPYEPPWSVNQHVRDIVATLDAEGISRTAVVGHSFGGLITTHLLAAVPDRIERAVLLDPAIAVAPRYALEQAEAIRTRVAWSSLAQARAARQAGLPAHAAAAVEEEVAAHVVETADGLRIRICPSAAVTAWSEMARQPVPLGGCTVPTLLVAAARAGDYVTDATRAWLRADLCDALGEAIVDSGHMLYWEAFEETAAHVRRFLG
jgi:lipase